MEKKRLFPYECTIEATSATTLYSFVGKTSAGVILASLPLWSASPYQAAGISLLGWFGTRGVRCSIHTHSLNPRVTTAPLLAPGGSLSTLKNYSVTFQNQ